MQNINYSSLFLANGNGLAWGLVGAVAVLAIVASILCWVLSAKTLKKKYEKMKNFCQGQEFFFLKKKLSLYFSNLFFPLSLIFLIQ